MSPKTAGSEPRGSSVADTNATMNTVLRPNLGKASSASNDSSHASMRAHYGRVGAPPSARIRGCVPRYTAASFFSTRPHPTHADRPHRVGESPVRRPDGRGDGSAVPPPVQEARRGLCGERDGDLAQGSLEQPEDQSPREP